MTGDCVPISVDSQRCLVLGWATAAPVHYLRREVSTAATNVRVTIAPPLIFHTRMNVFHLDEINTVAQTFRVDAYIEFRLRGISYEPEEDLVKALFNVYGFREDMLEVMKSLEVISKDTWSTLTT